MSGPRNRPHERTPALLLVGCSSCKLSMGALAHTYTASVDDPLKKIVLACGGSYKASGLPRSKRPHKRCCAMREHLLLSHSTYRCYLGTVLNSSMDRRHIFSCERAWSPVQCLFTHEALRDCTHTPSQLESSKPHHFHLFLSSEIAAYVAGLSSYAYIGQTEPSRFPQWH